MIASRESGTFGGVYVSVLTREVTNLAGIRGITIAGGATNVVGVKVAASRVTVAAGIDGVDMDVISWVMLICRLGKSERMTKTYRRDRLLRGDQ